MAAFTPPEATTRLCPQLVGAAPLLIRVAEIDPHDHCCRGPRCMAWRWAKGAYAEPQRKGFCGLAGEVGTE